MTRRERQAIHYADQLNQDEALPLCRGVTIAEDDLAMTKQQVTCQRCLRIIQTRYAGGIVA